MTHKDMLDLFTPGIRINVMYTDESSSAGVLIGWRENGIVLGTEDAYLFIPFASVMYIATDKETSHA